MLVAAFTWGNLWELALAVFLFAVGLSPAYFFVKLAGTADEASTFIRGAGDSALPVIDKVGGSVDRVKGQLDKVDKITDSAVRPVQKISGLAAGVSFGAVDFEARRDWRHAVRAGKEAAARRESDLLDELREAGA
ncbi:MAG TPA: hypothetical protein VF124_07295 [Gaiellaceae bacterium]